ncbi:fam-b protein [Plasmodium vinckei lentum]|uniref:Fam-b protein n=1 Tax=Plasmodium vinckei lentum TaxID=138297 RepID=A0A6V7RX96_PLAVN|nr:fam-b protein [Plasmodium vinckei lentum]
MRVFIFKFVFFLIIICSFEYAKNELYYANERSIYPERNVINFRNNRILADADNQFDLYDFYQSTLSLANQFSDYIDNDKEITNFRNNINSHIKKHKENNTFPNLNNVDKKTKNLFYELQKELEEVKKEFDNKRNSELGMQSTHNKRIIKKDENNFVPDHENFKHLENEEIFLKVEDYNFEDEYNEITSSNIYKEIKIVKNMNKARKHIIKNAIMLTVGCLTIISSGGYNLVTLLMPYTIAIIKNWWKGIKLFRKKKKLSR